MDERAGPGVARWLDMREHDVVSVFPDNRGLDDLSILQRAFAEDRIVVTCDKDYGELVYRLGQPHKGVVLLRLEDETTGSKIASCNTCWRTSVTCSMVTSSVVTSLPRPNQKSG